MSETRGNNGYDGEQLDKFLGDIDKLDEELMHLKAQYMANCKGPRSRIKDILAQVREADINMIAFREFLRAHRDDRARQARLDELEADDRDAYELLLEALGDFGDTDLGRAALTRAKPHQDGDEALGTL